MKILVLNGSPAGEGSITLQTVRYLEKRFPEASFSFLPAASRIRGYERDFAEARAKRKQMLGSGSVPSDTWIYDTAWGRHK